MAMDAFIKSNAIIVALSGVPVSPRYVAISVIQ
jgi:hypothetical protein